MIICTVAPGIFGDRFQDPHRFPIIKSEVSPPRTSWMRTSLLVASGRSLQPQTQQQEYWNQCMSNIQTRKTHSTYYISYILGNINTFESLKHFSDHGLVPRKHFPWTAELPVCKSLQNELGTFSLVTGLHLPSLFQASRTEFY